MYLPENDAQLHDILAELRVYAHTHALTRLAEELDDAIILLAVETRRNRRADDTAAATGADDGSRASRPDRAKGFNWLMPTSNN
jgi:hypothetical protein